MGYVSPAWWPVVRAVPVSVPVYRAAQEVILLVQRAACNAAHKARE